jgi:hypothetical protein
LKLDKATKEKIAAELEAEAKTYLDYYQHYDTLGIQTTAQGYLDLNIKKSYLAALVRTDVGQMIDSEVLADYEIPNEIMIQSDVIIASGVVVKNKTDDPIEVNPNLNAEKAFAYQEKLPGHLALIFETGKKQ